MPTENAVEVRLFARAREIVSSPRVRLDLSAAATVADLRRELAAAHPGLSALLPHSAVAVNCTYASDQTTIEAGDDIALIPPVAGG